MKTYLMILLSSVCINFCLAQVWQGDYLIQTQGDASAFQSECACTSINGNLVISGLMEHIDSLYVLEEVTGNVIINNNGYILK